ncbi:MAG: glycolate oxidase subunit GlcF [Acidiferrobacter sp.]
MSNPLPALAATARTRRVNELIRACVHCGFCNATCPTYQISGDEREGPRGRLSLMADLLAAPAQAASVSLMPLDHCLSCRSCETTCPAGIHYIEILNYVRETTAADQRLVDRAIDRLLVQALSARRIVDGLWRTLRVLRPLAPPSWRRRIPPAGPHVVWPPARHRRQIGLLMGCIQPSLAPHLDAQAAVVLDACGVSAIAVGPACCGALPYHLHAHDQARKAAMAQLAQWQPSWEGVTSTASGCTLFLHDYPTLLEGQTDAQAFAAKVQDVAAWIDPATLTPLPAAARLRLAWHAPCTLNHGLHGGGRIVKILQALGHTLVPVTEEGLCCGSAGPYALRHPRLAKALGQRKWQTLVGAQPAIVVTGNIGCLQHLHTHGDRPVHHWIEIVYAALTTPHRDDHG